MRKNGVCMSKCGRNVFKTRRYDSALSTHFSFFNLINMFHFLRYMLTIWTQIRLLPWEQSDQGSYCLLPRNNWSEVHLKVLPYFNPNNYLSYDICSRRKKQTTLSGQIVAGYGLIHCKLSGELRFTGSFKLTGKTLIRLGR